MLRSLMVLALLVPAIEAQEWNPFLDYKAELATLDAPPWMKEGTRLYWECAGSAYTQANAPRDTPHTSGSGFLTADVVSLVGRQAAIATRVQISTTGNMGQPLLAAPSVEAGYVTAAATGGPFWVHPTILAKAFKNWPVAKLDKDGAFTSWGATRGTYDWNGRKVTALHWTLGGGPKYVQYERFAYEEETGLLLYYSNAPMKNLESGRQVVALTRFAGRRDRQLPWAMGRPPAWLTRIGSYTFSGAWTVEIAGVPPMPMRFSSTVLLDSVGANYVTLKAAPEPGTPGGAEGGAVRVAGPTQTGGLWLPPLEIRKLRAGMVVDRDDLLGATVQIGYVGPSNYGRNIVSIAEDAAGYTLIFDYEIETGILLAAAVKDKILSKTTEAYFTGKQGLRKAPGGG